MIFPFSLHARLLAWFVVATGFFFSMHAAESGPPKPNIVLILVDDMGWTDLSCYGSRFYETPNIDRLASQGVRFTNAYSACTVCSPTRAAILTGRHPARLRITDWIKGHDRPKAKLRPPQWTMHLPHTEVTIAERLKEAGYATASMGKWHLGGDEFRPETHGFDINIGGDHRGQPPSYFSPYRIPSLPDGPAGEYITDRLTDEAVRFIEKNREKPFFLYLPHYTVHTPLQAKTNLIEKYRAKAAKLGQGGQLNATYAAMIESLDESVGRITHALDQQRLRERTIVIFTSDNGGLLGGARNPITSNVPARAGKGSAYEGGVRVPLIISWPGAPKGTTTAEPVISMDLFPTLIEAAGLAIDSKRPIDGVSLASLVRGPARLNRDALYWHYPHYHPGGATPYAATRAGDFRLVQFYENGRNELYNPASDPGETKDLAEQMPDKLLELGKKLHAWQGAVGAQWPMYNPAHEPKPIQPLADGSVLLHSRDAAIHGTTLRYEPQPHKNTLGWWSRVEDWVSWPFEVSKAGTYEIEILQGCGTGHGGSTVEVSVGDETVTFTVIETGGFQNFVPRSIGKVQLAGGTHTLAVRPKTKPGGAVMDVRQIVLRATSGK